MQTLINTKVPEFKVQAYHNNSFKTVSDKDLNGKWSIFFFYPADFTFVCPTELGDMADRYAEFQKMGVEVYGVSTDTHFVHKAWHDTSETIKKIKYPLLADPTGPAAPTFVSDTGCTPALGHPGCASALLTQATQRAATIAIRPVELVSAFRTM